MNSLQLNCDWKLHYFPQGKYKIDSPNELTKYEIPAVSAAVPGNVELSLSKAGILPEDLLAFENTLLLKEYEAYEWWYETDFSIPENYDNLYLRFNGVDCLAEYWLNDIKIGESENMFIHHEFDITSCYKKENKLFVRLRSPILEAYKYDIPAINIGSWSVFSADSINIRKAPHSYGWDIMPRVVSAGIWKNVELVSYNKYEFNSVYVTTISANCDKASLRFLYDIKMDYEGSPKSVKIEGKCGSSVFSIEKALQSKAGYAEIEIENPKLWWPYGYGEANIYNIKLTLLSQDVILAEKELNIGIRTAELVKPFMFKINGQPIMCKGSNWVPLDPFHSRDYLKYDDAFELVKDTGCNILRCWGGNVYEDEYFFELCDKNGVMVWQDFAISCAVYPQNDEFYSKMKKEADYIVKKYCNHPSIILWAGDNECDTTWQSFGTDPNLNKVTREILRYAVLNNAPNSLYLPSSPYLSEEVYENSLDLVEDHLWGPRDYFKSDFYKMAKANFTSEIGYHGCPEKKSLEKFISVEQLWPYKDKSEWILHSSDQTGNPARNDLVARQLKQLFGEIPDNLDDYVLASQISQAEAKKFFIEMIRGNKWDKTGIIWWNLLDGWPQISDAVVDYYFEKKLAYHYIKVSQQPFVIAAKEIANWKLDIIACNDTLLYKSGSYVIYDGETKEVLKKGDFEVNPNENKLLTDLEVFYSDQKLFIFEWKIGDEAGKNHYISGYPPFSLEKYKNWLEILKNEEVVSI